MAESVSTLVQPRQPAAGAHASTRLTLTPEDLSRWRATPRGRLAEAAEVELVMGLSAPARGQRLLDIGCGDGTYALVAAERGAAVTGMDLSEEMLRAARGRIRTKGFRVDL